MTVKNAHYWSANKFSLDNVLYYVVYTSEILAVPWQQLKFLDEASFQDRSLRRQRGWAEAGRALNLQRDPGSAPTYTAFCLTDLTSARGYYLSNLHSGTNTSLDTLAFIVACLDSAHLSPGDTLVMDNASIHCSAEILPILDVVCDFMAIELVFLPTYSPELNPVELVWAAVKNRMRNHRGAMSFEAELLLSFLQIDRNDVLGFYSHCIEKLGD
jgi:transposase